MAVGTIWSIGRLIGGLSSTVAASTSQSAGGAQGVWPWFVVVAGLLVTGQAVGGLSQLAQAQVSARYHEYVLDLVAETTMRPQGVAWLENPESAGRMRRLVEDVRHWLFRTGVDGTWQVLSVKLTGIGALVIASTWRWWAALVVALAFVLVGRAYVRWISRVYVPPGSEVLLSGRRASYLRAVVTGGRDAKEVRLFGLTDFFVERFREAALMADRLTAQSWRGASRPVVAASAVMVVILGGALVLLARDSMAGAVSVGSALAVLQALLAMSAFGPVDDAQTGLTKVATTMRHLEQVRASVALPAREALEASDTPRPRVPNGPSADGTGGRPGGGERRQPAEIVFDRVSFTYPARADPTLRRLSLRIPCGQSVAVVGVNGAGKSTLMKLLAGLYLPTEGRVLVDGQDAVKAQDERRVAVIFQDFAHYPLTLRANVAYGSLPLLDDEARLDRVLDRAGATSLMSRLGHGWDTVLSPEFEDGTDLSGGQWQRVALARALAAVEGGAGVLVLDEPTA
ncbi:MAG: ATP-binding cassette domain-containing protein, partial [Actinopolymorphaceae bacterium]